VTTADPDRAQFPIRISKSQDADTVIASASEAISPVLRALAKQSIVPQGEKEWIASSLPLPCANASRLSQAMTMPQPCLRVLAALFTRVLPERFAF
jgi:hypothetical protein